MNAPLVRDPNPSMARLLDFVDDRDSDAPLHVMALALRAALLECAEEQAVAVAGLEPDPDDPHDNEAAGQRFRLDCLGRLYMANKVVRRVSEHVTRIGERPDRPADIEDRAEVAEILAEGFHTAFRKAGESKAALRAYNAIAEVEDDDYAAVVDFVLDGLVAAGLSVTRDPAVCGDYPAPCNCDDPLIHNGN